MSEKKDQTQEQEKEKDTDQNEKSIFMKLIGLLRALGIPIMKDP